jgi:hypothetical protein
MRNLYKALIAFLFILIPIVLAVNFSPQGNIDLKSRYSVVGGVDGNFTNVYQGGSPVLTVGGGVSWSNLTDYPAACLSLALLP